MMTQRRHFLRSMGKAAGALVALGPEALGRVQVAAREVAGKTPEEAAQDEDFWLAVRRSFSLDSKHVSFNAGAWNPSPRAVHEALIRNAEFGNAAPLGGASRCQPWGASRCQGGFAVSAFVFCFRSRRDSPDRNWGRKPDREKNPRRDRIPAKGPTREPDPGRDFLARKRG
jgi:hypothetical protein